MKLKSFFIAAIALTGFAGNVLAQRDITSTYITNATLSDGTNGWTKSFTKNTQTNDPADAFSNSVRGNNTLGYASEAYAGWGSLIQTAYSMKQTITLPKGNYRLVNYSFFRQGGAYNTNSSKSLAYLKAGTEQVALKTLGSINAAGYANSQAEGANCFDAKMYRNTLEFSIASDNTAIEIGIEGSFDEAKSWCIVGMFELFDLDDVASVSSPTDVTYAITNPGFEYRNQTGWTSDNIAYQDNNWGNKSGIGFSEAWQWDAGLSNRSITQTLTGLPNGLYELSVYAHNINQRNGDAASTGMFVTANSEQTEIGAYGQYKVRATIDDGNLTIGIKLQNCTGNWIAFDRFELQFYGDPLQAFKDLLDEKVAEAQALVDGGTLRTGAAGQLQTIIDNNDNDDDAFTTEAQFNTAVSNIEAGITQANAIAATYAGYDSYRAQFETLKEGVASGESLITFETAITTANTAVANATSTDVAETQKAAVRAAAMTFISNTDGQFDITFLASQNYWDWKKKDGSNAGIVADQFLTNRPNTIPSFAESYETTCATTGTVLYQTIEDLPAGYYQVGMYAAAMFTSGRGFTSEATEGDANRTYAFAGDLNDASSILRTGSPIAFATSRDFNDLTTLDVNVHLTGSGQTNDLTFGVQKDANGSNWHFAQIVSIVYSNSPDLTQLKATRDALVAEATGLKNGADADYLTSAQKTALQDAIDAGNDADDFEELNTVTMTTLPNAINTAKQQIAQAKAAVPGMLAALERFENNYNLQDGTDYRRVTMSAKAWTDLLTAVNNVTTALDDISQASSYATLAAALIDQMDATDASLRLFKSYKAMVEGCQSLSIAEGTTYDASSYMENTAIAALNTAFISYREGETTDIDMAGFLGGNLDFSETQGSLLVEGTLVYDIVGWEETYSNVQANERIQTNAEGHSGELYLRSNWTDNVPVLEVAKLKMLPEGDYQLSLSWNSPMTNMTNHSAYVLDGTSTAIGETTSAATTLTYDFTVSGAATDFDLILGFQKQNSGNTGAEIVADNITLICLAGTPFQQAYDAAEAADLDTDATAAAKAAVTEYAAYDGNESGLLDNGERGDAYWQAVYVLRNAKTIADNSGDATSFVTNADLTNTTKVGNFPTGWTGTYEGDEPGGNAWIGEQDGDQVFNIWAGNITLIDMYQTINNLPQGAYRLSIDMGTNNLPANGDGAPVFNFVYPANMNIGASQMVTTDNTGEHRAFDTYTSAAEVGAAHSVTIGIRSEGHYFQMKNVKLEYIGNAATAAAETDASYLRQDFFWGGRNVDGQEFDYTGSKYTNATGVTLYPSGDNQIIHALSGQLTNTQNVDVNGTCAELVITDGKPLTNTKSFTATTVSYTRSMTNDWGTVILPFALTSDEYVQFYSLKASDDEYMTFEKVTSVDANSPVAFKKLSGDGITLTGSNVNVVATNGSQVDNTTADNWSIEGYYTAQTIPDYEGIYYIASNKFWAADGQMTVNPFRAIFRYSGSNPVKAFNIFVDDATGIKNLGAQDANESIYDLSGRRVITPSKNGLYIRGGKKVIIK